MYSTVKHQVALKLLAQEAELYRRSTRTMLSEQRFVVRRYFNTLVHRARQSFKQANAESRHWLKTALKPITEQMQEHRDALEERLKDLKTAGQSRKHIQEREAELAKTQQQLMRQADQLARLQATLTGTSLTDPSPDSELTGTDR
jgi:chromosome segregation ATPase